MRKLTSNEILMINKLIGSSEFNKNSQSKVEKAVVCEMCDGGMGSLKFLSDREDRKPGIRLAEAEFKDVDGVIVSVVLDLDNYGDLYELDIWKTDFSKLRQWPSSDGIKIINGKPRDTHTKLTDNQ